MTTLFNNLYFVRSKHHKATLMPPPLIKQYQEKGKGALLFGRSQHDKTRHWTTKLPQY